MPDLVPLPVLDCDDCGRCCDRQGSPPFAVLHPTLYLVPMPPKWAEAVSNHDEFLRWKDVPPEALKVLHDYFHGGGELDRYERELPCLWYDGETKRCKYYDHRPNACREFEVGGRDCLGMRAARREGVMS